MECFKLYLDKFLIYWKCDLYDWENYFIGVDMLMEFFSNNLKILFSLV